MNLDEYESPDGAGFEYPEAPDDYQNPMGRAIDIRDGPIFDNADWGPPVTSLFFSRDDDDGIYSIVWRL